MMRRVTSAWVVALTLASMTLGTPSPWIPSTTEHFGTKNTGTLDDRNVAAANSATLTTGNNDTEKLGKTRILQEQSPFATFHRLSCNAGLESKPCSLTWTSRFSNEDVHESVVVVPCGKCMVMNFRGPTLLLRGGLDIQGKLVFPPDHKAAPLEIIAPFVRVQGELHINNNKIVDGTADLKFTLTGNDEEVTKFFPADSNRNACDGSKCKVGTKPFVVAGGRLVVDALPAHTPAWVKLHDVLSASKMRNLARLNEVDTIIQFTDGFDDDDDDDNDNSNSGANDDEHDSQQAYSSCTDPITEIRQSFEDCFGSNPQLCVQHQFAQTFPALAGALKRQHTSNSIAPALDLRELIAQQGKSLCIIPDHTYTIEIQLRLTDTADPILSMIRQQTPYELQRCAFVGDETCLELAAHWTDWDGRRLSNTIYREDPSSRIEFGEWFTLGVPYEFSEDELDRTNLQHALRVDGPYSDDVFLELRSLSITLDQLDTEEFPNNSPPPTITPTVDPTLAPIVIENPKLREDDGGNSDYRDDNPIAAPASYEPLAPTPDPTPSPFFDSANPTLAPVLDTVNPTPTPVLVDASDPTSAPVLLNTSGPTFAPVLYTSDPTYAPTADPTYAPTADPTYAPILGRSDPIAAPIPYESNPTPAPSLYTDDPTPSPVRIPEPERLPTPKRLPTPERMPTPKQQPLFPTPEDYYESTPAPVRSASNKPLSESTRAPVPPLGNANPAMGLVVPDTVLFGWGVGAEILITSHTHQYSDQRVRRITSISSSDSTPGYVVLGIDESIPRPSTERDNPDYAVEVALLSRNVVIEGSEEKEKGFHLIVFQTGDVPQLLSGVEFRHGGQQGNLGRYPIHFHLSGNVPDAVVSKNLIRESHQRCIVIHGTNHVLVDQNVAYNTKGHCFVTEDGNEVENTFRHNLGALTLPVTKGLPNKKGPETDKECSTFWNASPSNNWIGNVAAGSAVNGFWFELQRTPRGEGAIVNPDMNPQRQPLGEFLDNVAHSNSRHGFRTYPDGYLPDKTATFHKLRCYRNKGAGVFVHHSENLAFEGGLFSDNLDQIDLDRGENIKIRNAEIIGMSEEYRAIAASQGLYIPCAANRGLSGIEIHTFVRDKKNNGAVIEKTSFSGFRGTGCNDVAAVAIDDETIRRSFDFFTTFSQISMEGRTTTVDFCKAEKSRVQDIYIVDLDSTLRSTSTSFSGTSTLISNHPQMTGFIDVNAKCTPYPDQCYLYCEDTCLRTVTYAVDPADSDVFKLQVCSTTESSNCIEASATFYLKTKDSPEQTIMANSLAEDRRYFSASLPSGKYEARFIDPNDKGAWPTFIETTYSDALCGNSFKEEDVKLEEPAVSRGQCSELIRNGDAESSSDHHTFWLHRSGGIRLVPGAGMSGSNAFGDIEPKNAASDSFAQYLDMRCLNLFKGDKFEIQVWAKLVDKKSNGATYYCDQNKERCPQVGIRAYRDGKQYWASEPAAEMMTSFKRRDFQLIHSVFEINNQMANADAVLFYIERNVAGLSLLVDNVSMKRLPDGTPSTCSNELVFNGDFATGDHRFWEADTSKALEVVSPGVDGGSDYALKSIRGTPEQLARGGCIEPGERYVVEAKFQLLDRSGKRFACDNVSPRASTKCPEIKLRPDVDDNIPSTRVAQAIGTPSTNGWNELYGILLADKRFADVDGIRIAFGNLIGRMDLVVDNISVYKLPKDCSELILNNDMEKGHAQFWYKVSGGSLSNVGGYNSATAIRFSNRSAAGSGPFYNAEKFMDYRCVTPESRWRIRAQIKIVNRGTDEGASCNLATGRQNEACPSVVIRIFDSNNLWSNGVALIDERIMEYSATTWDKNGFNQFDGTFTVPKMMTKLDRVFVLVRDFRKDLDVIIDDFSITPA